MTSAGVAQTELQSWSKGFGTPPPFHLFCMQFAANPQYTLINTALTRFKSQFSRFTPQPTLQHSFFRNKPFIHLSCKFVEIILSAWRLNISLNCENYSLCQRIINVVRAKRKKRKRHLLQLRIPEAHNAHQTFLKYFRHS